MSLIRWQPDRELESLQREVSRLFGSVFDTPTPTNGAGVRRWIPSMDLVEDDSSYVLRADLPGLSQDDVKIEFQENVLTISGERRTEQESTGKGHYRLERATGTFSRSLTLPEGVDAAAITATFDRGVLAVSIPKPVERQPQRITIAATDRPAVEAIPTAA